MFSEIDSQKMDFIFNNNVLFMFSLHIDQI